MAVIYNNQHCGSLYIPKVSNCIITVQSYVPLYIMLGGRRGGDRMVVGYTTTYAISAYHD
jgi:hypothetical protein